MRFIPPDRVLPDNPNSVLSPPTPYPLLPPPLLATWIPRAGAPFPFAAEAELPRKVASAMWLVSSIDSDCARMASVVHSSVLHITDCCESRAPLSNQMIEGPWMETVPDPVRCPRVRVDSCSASGVRAFRAVSTAPSGIDFSKYGGGFNAALPDPDVAPPDRGPGSGFAAGCRGELCWRAVGRP